MQKIRKGCFRYLQVTELSGTGAASFTCGWQLAGAAASTKPANQRPPLCIHAASPLGVGRLSTPVYLLLKHPILSSRPIPG